MVKSLGTDDWHHYPTRAQIASAFTSNSESCPTFNWRRPDSKDDQDAELIATGTTDRPASSYAPVAADWVQGDTRRPPAVR